jgi:hypothetical protein
VPKFTGTGVMAEREGGWWPAVIAPVPGTGKEEGADGRVLPVRGGADMRERERGAADKWGRAASGRGGIAARTREKVGRERRGVGAGERGGSMGQNRPSREGEKVFPFLFFFSLIPFILYTNIPLYFLGAKMKYYV